MIASGTPRDFRADAPAHDPDLVWRRWTTPSTRARWDRGLSAASLAGEFLPGARGTITGLDGRVSDFVVIAVDDDGDVGGGGSRRVEMHVPLPGARMVLVRTLLDGTAEHRVRFAGPAAPAWGLLLGRRFRPLLAPTVAAVVAPDRSDG